MSYEMNPNIFPYLCTFKIQSMKIVILGTAYPYRGGLAAFNERLAREYQNQGHEVEMITFTLQYPNFLFCIGGMGTCKIHPVGNSYGFPTHYSVRLQ